MIMCCAAGGLLAITIASWAQLTYGTKSINANEVSNGILSCLVAITASCPYVNYWSACLIGSKYICRVYSYCLHKRNIFIQWRQILHFIMSKNYISNFTYNVFLISNTVLICMLSMLSTISWVMTMMWAIVFF